MDELSSLSKIIGSVVGAILVALTGGLWFRHKNSNVNLDVTVNSATENRILALQDDADSARRDRAEYLKRAEIAEADVREANHHFHNCEQDIIGLKEQIRKLKRIIIKLDPDSEIYLRDDPPTKPDMSI